MGVIYEISNTINDRVYIGSSINYESRHKEHISDIKNKKHHNIHLQRFCDKYGVNTLEFNVIEVCDDDIILEREQVFIDIHKDNSFNISTTSSAPMTGKKHTNESKNKISIKTNGKNNPMFGTKRPRWIVDKMIESNINRLRTKRESVISRLNRKLRQEVIIKNDDKTIRCMSITHASKIIGVSTQSIQNAIKRNTFKCKGWGISLCEDKLYNVDIVNNHLHFI